MTVSHDRRYERSWCGGLGVAGPEKWKGQLKGSFPLGEAGYVGPRTRPSLSGFLEAPRLSKLALLGACSFSVPARAEMGVAGM